MLSYDFIHPAVCLDCQAEVLVGQRLREQGISKFLRNYHKPALYKIKKSPQMYEKFLHYDNQFKLNYKKRFNNIENETPDIILSDNSDETRGINFRIGKHSPLWFYFYAMWNTFSGESYFSQIIIPANIISILYLVSLYVLLSLFFKRDEYRSKMSIILLILLLPAFLKQTSMTTNDFGLGIIVAWVTFFLLKNDNEKINCNDLMVGLFYSTAVLIKFTSLTLLLPITLFYLIKFKLNAIPKLLIIFLCFIVIPVLLYGIFGYDMILNILTGSAEEFTLRANVGGSLFQRIIWHIVYEQFNFGIPFVLIYFTHIFKIRNFVTRDEALTSYIFIVFFFLLIFLLMASGLSRHWLGFIPLTIPALVYIYKNCEEKNKMILLTSIFLIINNVQVLLHEGIIMSHHYQTYLGVKYWNY
jgi:hypothetical protein